MQSIYACPSCRAVVFEQTADNLICSACRSMYPLVLGRIVDFRLEGRDSTANFSFQNDNRLAEAMLQAYPHCSTYNELNVLYQSLKIRQNQWSDSKPLDLTGILPDGNALPSPMSFDQCAHGGAVLEKIEEFLAEIDSDIPKDGVALENGCGLGLYIDGFARHFKQLIVLDLSLCYLILASKILDERGIGNAQLICGSVENLPIQDGVVDFAHSNNVIEHVNDQSAMLGEAHRVLNSNGVLYIQSPNRYSLWKEPHFAVPGYGFIPKPLRRWLIQRKQKRSIDDISLLTLGEFRALLRRQPWYKCRITFVPRRMKQTVKKGLVRGTVVRMLDSKVFGDVFNTLINKKLLTLMPYHVALCIKTAKN